MLTSHAYRNRIAGPTTLYRAYSIEGDLLYVGITKNPAGRFSKHACEKSWWGEVHHITLEHFATRRLALDAERAAIENEDPAYNIAHSYRRCI